jgi:hypothetical protein
MLAREKTVEPSAAHERALFHRVVSALDRDGVVVVDASLLAGNPPDAKRLAAGLREHVTDRAVIACQGVLEQLPDFLETVETLVALATEREATVLLALPNEAFAGSPPAERRSMWSEGAVDELRRLLPADHAAFHQVALRGAALVGAGNGGQLPLTVEIDPRSAVPVGFVLAFGPLAHELRPVATAGAADLTAERAYERERTAELEVLRARVHGLEPRAGLATADRARPAQ